MIARDDPHRSARRTTHKRRVTPAAALALVLVLAAAACRGPSASIQIQELGDQLEDILSLHTYEHSYRSVVYFGEKRRFLFLDTMDRQVLFAVDVRVQAGIDLDDGVEVRPGTGDAEGQLFVTLPAATITLVDADEDTITEYFQTDRGGSVGWLEYSQEIENAKVKARQSALADGILTQAETNAKTIVTEFFDLAGFGTVTVEVRRDGVDG